MPYRFVHAADIHLDSPLKSLALRDPALAALVGDATRQTFVRIVDLCLEERVDALMLAGDLYDGDQTSMKTARFLADQLRRLDQAGIRAFVIRGNHDHASKITKELVLPDGVTRFGARAEAVALDRTAGGLDVVVHGLSFAQAQATESFLPRYRAPVEGAVNIGLMHTSLDGAQGHDDYAPCTLAALRASGFSYWALGHVHLRRAPDAAGREPTVVMPGIPQGRDINEAGAKGVTLVTVADDRGVSAEPRLTSIAQFERVAVPLDGLEDWNGIAAAIEAGLGATRDAVPSEHLVARLTLTGTTPLAWRLRRDFDLVREEARARGERLGRVWIEQVEVACREPARSAVPVAGDPLLELRRIVDEVVLPSAAFRAEMAAVADELRSALPSELRALFGEDAAGQEAALEPIVADGVEEVLARLHGRAEAASA